jgi:LL-diaminopimelate aminotransferase
MSATLSVPSRIPQSPVAIPARSDRLAALPPFLFDEIDRKKRERIAAGADVINLGVGDPDQPTPEFIVEAMNKAMRDLVNQQYPAVGGGLKVFRESCARFMHERFGVKVDPMRHIVCCIGSKDGIAHLPWAVTNPGDTVLLPDPAYPVYEIGAALAHCKVYKTPISNETGWRPVFDEIPAAVAAGARLLWLNYPSNPTAAVADIPFFERAVEWTNATWHAGSRGCILASDLAYSELYFEHRPISIWQAANADIGSTPAIEFHSLSKTFNMTGWRIGFAVGHADIISALAGIKANVDSGVFNAIQVAGAAALDNYTHPAVERMRRLYRERRDVIVPGLRAAGCEVHPPEAGFFVWARTPKTPLPGGGHQDSMAFAGRLLEQADTVVVPGSGFSPRATEWFRVALTVDAPRMAQAAKRIAALGHGS